MKLSISKFLHWPKSHQWKHFFGILSRREKTFFLVFLILFLSSFAITLGIVYLNNTEVKAANGGEYAEGVIGSPQLINPVYAAANDTDRDLAELIFSGLMKYDSQSQLQPDLAKSYSVLNEGKTYEFALKENLFWSDGRPLNANDIVFTIKTIQNSDYKSPLRANWLGVEIEKVSDSLVRFKLKNPSTIFLENTVLKILPKHIWENISANNFPLAVYNLKPVGSGPFKLKELKQNKEGKVTALILTRNNYYFNLTPHLSQISFKFFDSEENLIKALKKGWVEGLNISSGNLLSSLPDSLNLYSPTLPRYFAVFFNQQKAKIFNQIEVRKALDYGTDKQALIDELLAGQGKIVDSPILAKTYGYLSPKQNSGFDPEQAKSLLEKAGLKEENGVREKIVKKNPAFQFKSNLKQGSQGTEVKELQKCLGRDAEIYPEGEITGLFGEKTKAAVIKFQEKYRQDILQPQELASGTGEVLQSTRAKLNEVCLENPEEKILFKFTLVTSDHPQLALAAEILKEQWKKLGAEVEIKTFDIGTLEREVIKTRDYDALLFGEVLGSSPDPFPFWHSSQKKDPGLNLALYENKRADKLLQEARETLDSKKKQGKLESFQNILLEDAPAVFLYSPDYLYLVSDKIKGITIKTIIDTSKRFSNVESWYIKTKRTWK